MKSKYLKCIINKDINNLLEIVNIYKKDKKLNKGDL